jgi:colanic acid/amylovoran biosynthesis glycosyltransferase
LRTTSLLLVLPLHAYRHGSCVFIDAQARNGLRFWLDSFGTLSLACPTFDKPPPPHYAPIEDPRVSFTALPVAYRPHTFAVALPSAALALRRLIQEAEHLHFAIGGIFGDWASIAAIIARTQRRKFCVWTDRVESKVLAYQAQSKSWPKRYYNSALAKVTARYERKIIRLSDLGLFHGMDCFEEFSPYSKNPRVVHDIHLDESDLVTDDQIERRLDRRLESCKTERARFSRYLVRQRTRTQSGAFGGGNCWT